MAKDKAVDSTVLDGYFTNIANAIRGKNGESGTYTPAEMPAKITAIPSGGGGGVVEKDVNFYDYDGTLVDSYTKAEFLALSAMPDNPTHTGLTAQGWNWSLSDAKTYVTDYGLLDIGQTYVTDDGKTRLYVHLDEYSLTPVIGLCGNSAGDTVVINWGDGSAEDTVSLNTFGVVDTSHTYATGGDYVITLNVTSGKLMIMGNSSKTYLFYNGNGASSHYNYYQAVKKIELGNNVYIREYAFGNFYKLETITIPSNVEVRSSNTYTFQGCYSLKSITLPSGLTYLGGGYNFPYCYGLKTVSLPKSITIIPNYAFQYCSGLTRITIPSDVTTIGSYAFQRCSGLTRITIPSDVTTIQSYAFQQCYTLKSIDIPSSVTTIQSYAFQTCCSLESVDFNASVTQLPESLFSTCTTLRSDFVVPDTVTQLMASVFSGCYSLATLTLDANLTSMGSIALSNLYSLQELHFKSITPPSAAASYTFNNLPTTCKIYVPAGSLTDYTTATNYPSSSTYTYIEE